MLSDTELREQLEQETEEQKAELRLPQLRPDQWRIVQHQAKVKVIASGRRWGKSTLGGVVEVATAASGGRCAWMAPNYKNTRPLWAWVSQAIKPMVDAKLAKVSQVEKTIEFPMTGGYLGIYSLDNPSSVRGDAFDLVVIDEASRIPPSAWTEDVMPTLADRNGQAFLISTPSGKGWFYEEFKRGLEDNEYQASFTAPSSANPMPSIQRAVERARQTIPDQAFRQEWLAEFVDDALVLFTPDYFQHRYNPLDYRLPDNCYARFMSWDTAVKDSDQSAYSACVIADLMPDYKLQIREVWRDKVNFPTLIDNIARLAYQHRESGKLYGIIIEDRSSGTSAYQTISSASDPWLVPKLIPYYPTVGKAQRAAQAGVWCKNGSVVLPEPMLKSDGRSAVPWLHNFEQELYMAGTKAPAMDQVDALSQLVIMLQPYLEVGLRLRQQQYTRRKPPSILPAERWN